MYPIYHNYLTSNPVIGTSAYDSGDQVGPDYTKLTNLFLRPGFSRLQSVMVIDAAKQKSALDIFLWNQEPTEVTSADNDAFAISAAGIKAKLMGIISIAAADYKDTSAQAAAVLRDLNYLLKSKQGTTNPSGRDAWFTIVSRGTPTYAAATDLVFNFSFE